MHESVHKHIKHIQHICAIKCWSHQGKSKREVLTAGVEFHKLHVSSISPCVCGWECLLYYCVCYVNVGCCCTSRRQAASCEMSPPSPQGSSRVPVLSSSASPGGLLCWVRGVWSGCLSANTPSIADMKGCQKCDGRVASWALATAATSGVRGEIDLERAKHGGALWPDDYPDWIHLVDRTE